ncbi:MAG TPA: flagellar biosynthetic protein FliO [Nocardioidaceae bacterium]|nr:flagellar biosynthetic protein FliO [Nocardioidaceae bacterium]
MLELVLRVVFSLSVVLGLLWLIARVSSRRLRGSSHQGLVRTLVRQPLSRGSSLAVVSVGARVLVVGVTEQQVNLLTELDPSEVETPAGAETDPDSAGIPRNEPSVVGDPRNDRSAGALGGSVLSTQTWKQAFAAATKRNGGTS